MKIAIIGSGAMGCRFGVALHNAGADVWLFDVWKEHIESIAQKGLIVHDGQEVSTIRFNATTDIESISEPDAIMVFTKSMHTKSALEQAKKIMGPKTAVITLQNGLANLGIIEEFTPDIVAGVTNYAGDLMGPGEVELKGSGYTKIMALSEGTRSLAQDFCEILNKGGINTTVATDILVDIWEKVAFNAAMNTLTAITSLTVGQLGSVKEGHELANIVSGEVVAVANKKGIKANLEEVHKTVHSVFDPAMSGDHKTSMLQDVLMKRPTEIESICGAILKEAEKVNVEVPHIETVYKLIKVLEQTYQYR